MLSPFIAVERARLPASQLGRLATLRCTGGVEVSLHDRELWVRWSTADETLARALLALPGCRLYTRRDERWHEWRQALPAFDVPEDLHFRPLWQVVFPMPVRPAPASDFLPIPAVLSLARDETHRPATAMACSLEAMLAWAEGVPACVVNRLQGVIRGKQLFVLGARLPWCDPAERFWGRSVLAPLGYRPDPPLADDDLRRALAVAETDLAILRPDRCEVIALDRFTALSHAALRLARAEGAP